MYTIDVRQDGLGRFARVSAPTRALAEQRAQALSQRWNEQFERRQAVLRRSGGNVVEALLKLDAEERTEDAARSAAALTTILLHAVRTPPSPDWSPLYDTAPFAEVAPVEPVPPKADSEPQPSQFKRPPLTFGMLFNPRALRRRKEAAWSQYRQAHDAWEQLKRWREQKQDKALKAFRAQRTEWLERQAAYRDLQSRANARLDALREGYLKGRPEAVMGHCDLTLLALDRPEGFPCFWTMTFTQGALQLDYDLPSMAQVPVVKAVKYLAGRFETVLLAESERERLYGEALFQTALAVLHTLFAADSANVIKTIAFNGWSNTLAGTGARRACDLSVTATKAGLAALDLSDPQAAFRALNGTMSSKLAAMAARLVS